MKRCTDSNSKYSPSNLSSSWVSTVLGVNSWNDGLGLFMMILIIWHQWQEGSPPAWTQEAHHPLRSKYTLCCSGRGYPPVLGSDLDGGSTPSQVGGYPLTPAWTWGKGYTPPTWTWEGGMHPPPTWTWEGGMPPTWTWEGGTPPPPQMWTDRHLWKQYLPSHYVRGR